MKFRIFPFLFLLLIVCLNNCKRKTGEKFNFSLCREIQNEKCIPPLIRTEAIYFNNIKPESISIETYIENIHSQSFLICYSIENWQKKIKSSAITAWAVIAEEKSIIKPIDHSLNALNATGCYYISDILNKYYAGQTTNIFKGQVPVILNMKFTHRRKVYLTRQVTLIINNE